MKESNAQAEWIKTHTRSCTVKLNYNTDADILEWLNSKPSVAGAFKAAARDAIKATNSALHSEQGERGQL